MRKIFAIVLALTLLCLSACSKNTAAPKTTAEATATEAVTEPAVQEAATPAETGAPVESDPPAETEAAVGGVIDVPQIEAKYFPSMDGSTANLPLARMLYRLCTGADDFKAQNDIHFTTTNNCYFNLMDGETDLVIAYEPGPDPKEDVRYKDLEMKPVGLDALVFLCNEGNKVESLTGQQIIDIYSGKMKNWKEAGGADKPIIPFQRTLNSGSQTLMQDLVMKDTPLMDAPTEWRPGEMGDLVDAVAGYNNDENAIGYSVYYYINNMYSLPGIRLMKVDGVAPTNETIQSGEYPYVNPFYVAIRKDTPKDSHARKIFEWLTTTDGQSLVEETGYVSLTKGGKKLPETLTAEKTVTMTTKTPFAINGEWFDGMAGVQVFGNDLKPSVRYSDIRLPGDDYQVMYGDLIAAQLPLPVEKQSGQEFPDYYAGPACMGLFNVKTGEWAVKPEYQYVYYDFRDPENPVYILDHPDDITEWDCKGELLHYDKYGALIETEAYQNGDDKWEKTKRFDGYFEESGTWDGEKETVDLGGNSKFVRYVGDKHLCELYVDGEPVHTSQHGHVIPYGSAVYHASEVPWGWKCVSMYDMDEEYNMLSDSLFIIDENGKTAAAFGQGQNEYLVFTARDYCLYCNDTQYTVIDMKANTVYRWIREGL